MKEKEARILRDRINYLMPLIKENHPKEVLEDIYEMNFDIREINGEKITTLKTIISISIFEHNFFDIFYPFEKEFLYASLSYITLSQSFISSRSFSLICCFKFSFFFV